MTGFLEDVKFKEGDLVKEGAPMLVLPKRCCTFTLLYRTPPRCAGLCCQTLPLNGLTTGRFTLIVFLFQLIPPPQ